MFNTLLSTPKAKELLYSDNPDKFAVLYEWVQSNKVTKNEFVELVQAIEKYNEWQVQLDSFD